MAVLDRHTDALGGEFAFFGGGDVNGDYGVEDAAFASQYLGRGGEERREIVIVEEEAGRLVEDKYAPAEAVVEDAPSVVNDAALGEEIV